MSNWLTEAQLGTELEGLTHLFLYLLFSFILKMVVDQLLKKLPFRKGSEIYKASIRGIFYGILILFGLVFIINFHYWSHIALFGLIALTLLVPVFEVFRNGIYGLIMFARKTIQIGDRIEINETQGIVDRLTLTSCLIISSDNSVVRYPNAIFYHTAFKRVNETHDDDTSYLEFDLTFRSGNYQKLAEVSLNAVYSSLYVDVSQLIDLTIKNIDEAREQTTLHFKLFTYNVKYTEKLKSDLLLRVHSFMKENDRVA